MQRCHKHLKKFMFAKSFDLLLSNTTNINSAISQLAEPVRSLVTFIVPKALVSTPKDCDYKRYIEIGKHLSHDSKVVEISDELRTLRVPQNFSRYAAIIGPSLLGKTQFAFALSTLRKVIYVNLSSEKETNAQRIYESFAGVSDLFKQVMYQDSRDHIGEPLLTKPANELAVFRGKLLTLGLLSHLMKFPWPRSQEENWFDQFVSIQSVKIEKLSIDDFSTRFNSTKKWSFKLFYFNILFFYRRRIFGLRFIY